MKKICWGGNANSLEISFVIVEDIVDSKLFNA